jgi:hypothetical protein
MRQKIDIAALAVVADAHIADASAWPALSCEFETAST